MFFDLFFYILTLFVLVSFNCLCVALVPILCSNNLRERGVFIFNLNRNVSFNAQANKSNSTGGGSGSAASFGQNTPTAVLNSARGSSVYNSRRTSIDNSMGSDMQLPSSNINMNHEGAIAGPDNTINLETGTASNDKKLVKQESLDKVSNSSNAGGESRNPSNGALNLNSIADLEKKLAALRHADNTEEVKQI